MSEVGILTTLYLAKNDHRWVIFISLKTINSRPDAASKLFRSLLAKRARSFLLDPNSLLHSRRFETHINIPRLLMSFKMRSLELQNERNNDGFATFHWGCKKGSRTCGCAPISSAATALVPLFIGTALSPARTLRLAS